jgi:tricorn protease
MPRLTSVQLDSILITLGRCFWQLDEQLDSTMKRFQIFCLLVFCSLFFTNDMLGQTTPSAGMTRHPDVSKTHIVFSYANDLWIVDRDGGVASPLASPAGAERFPRFSPDGKQIAFSGNYEGGTDIYTIPTAGGDAKRITFHPSSESLCDWTPDGKSLLFSSNGMAGLGRQPQLFTIGVKKNPLAKQLPVPYGTNGTISADKKWFAYTPHSRDTRTWKRYRGGMASDVWLFNLKDKTSKQITDFEGTDSFPMWHKSKVYYLSDAGDSHRLNIWCYDSDSEEREQVTEFDEFDCKWPSIGPGKSGNGEIVFSNGPKLYLLDLKSKKSKTVDIKIPGDRPSLRPNKVDASDFVEWAEISKTGKRIAVEARGDIWTVPVKNGAPRNMTKTSGVAERQPSWSPDGRWIAYLSDKTGEYEVYVTQSDGRGETTQLTDDGDCFRFMGGWSPDSKHLTYSDKSGKLFLLTIESKESKLIDTDPMADQIEPNWSHNSQWLCYSKASDERAPVSSIWVYNVKDGTRKQLTENYYNDTGPVFDNKGEYIFFHSNRSFTSPQYEDLGTSFIYAGTDVMMAMPLRADVEHPMLPKIDEEEWEEDKKDGDEKSDEDSKDDSDSEDSKEEDSKEEDSKEDDSNEDDESEPADKSEDDSEDGDSKSKDTDEKPESKKKNKGDKKDGKKDDKDKPIKIEFEGIEHRAFQLPVGTGSFGGLVVNHSNQLIYSERPSSGPPSIKIFDLSADEKKAETVVTGAGNFGITADGKKLFVFSRGDVYVIAAAKGQKLDKKVSTDNMTVSIQPREEWKQLLREAWRLERDFFYDPTMHGVDWDAVWDQYQAMLEDCASRADVGFLIGEMISELNVGHAYYRGGGDVESGPSSDVGLLGCRFEADGDAYKIAEIFQGAVWDVDARNPLVMAGVKTGQYVLAVNDQELTTDTNPYSAFAGTRGQTVLLTISDDKEIDDDDKRVAVRTIRSDNNLRFRGWIEAKRKRVEEKTDGKVGYIYVVNTGVPGQNDLVRQFFAQLNKEALIVDDRWNGGGQIPTRFIELLNRPVTNYWARRDGRDWTWPPDSHQGPKCMLINGMAGSGGDMFPSLFKQNKLGKLIGMRTWGGLVGISGGPGLIDGTSVTMPSFAYYEKDGSWGIEGHGVDPDMKVVDDPAKMQDGGDPQLDAAIDLMLKEIEASGYKAPKRPAYPNRSKFGIAPKDK